MSEILVSRAQCDDLTLLSGLPTKSGNRRPVQTDDNTGGHCPCPLTSAPPPPLPGAISLVSVSTSRLVLACLCFLFKCRLVKASGLWLEKNSTALAGWLQQQERRPLLQDAEVQLPVWARTGGNRRMFLSLSLSLSPFLPP